MSSFVGHTLIGISIARLSKYKPVSLQWSLWLGFLAIFPDLQYIELWLFGTQRFFSYSHSIGYVLVLPLASLLYLTYKKVHHLAYKSIQLFTAAFSHLVLDLFVGVFPKPYLWPISHEKFRLSWGVLPSAGKIDVHNYYLYKNLLIELGILLPIIGCVYLLQNRHTVTYFFSKLVVLFAVWVPFVMWGLSLYRE